MSAGSPQKGEGSSESSLGSESSSSGGSSESSDEDEAAAEAELGVDQNGRVVAGLGTMSFAFRSFSHIFSGDRRQVAALKQDCAAACAVKSVKSSEYSEGTTFWVGADADPESLASIERVALDIFRYHTAGAASIDPARSGAEWWTLAMDSSGSQVRSEELSPTPRLKMGWGVDVCFPGRLSTCQVVTALRRAFRGFWVAAIVSRSIRKWVVWAVVPCTRFDEQVSWHWDKDYSLEQQGVSISPHLATVTYLSDLGAPTLMVPSPRQSLLSWHQSSGLTEIYLRFEIPILILMTRSR
jgi:hypothetical protein